MAEDKQQVVTEFDYGDLSSIPKYKNVNIRFEDILEIYHKKHNDGDGELLTRAYIFAAKEHLDQVRRSGEPYLIHPMNVAKTLAEMNMDETTIAVGFLHDVVEDTSASVEKIREYFGDDIAELVDGVTKIGQIEFKTLEHKQAENFRKLWLAMARDIRVIIVKIADRLHNMSTLDALPPQKQKRIARETMEIYVPIANRLGMGNAQRDLQELCFKYLYPRQYKALAEKVEKEKKISAAAIKRIETRIRKEMEKAELEVKIQGRVKSNYSIFLKMRSQDIPLSEVYDYLAFRVIAKSVADCYTVLGIIHNIWRPIPGRFKDYIAMPKPNNYRSLHTSVLDTTGNVFEIQIRTEWMDIIANEGVPAHWRYKEDGTEIKDEQELQYVNWLRDLVQRQQEWQHPEEFLNALKIDLYPDNVYCFTPKGEVKSFPNKATALDFAFAVHTEVGNQCVGAKINGKIVPLRTKLKNGDVVEILTRKGSQPKRDWLNFAKTTKAITKIKQYLNKEEKERSHDIGEKLLRKALNKYGYNINKQEVQDKLLECCADWGVSNREDLYASIGMGKLAIKQVLNKFLPQDADEKEQPLVEKFLDKVTRRADSSTITVKGHNDILVHLAKCCSPLPGEPIIGFITRGRGISVHSKTCPNVRTLTFNPERIVDARWEAAKGERFLSRILIQVDDSSGMLAKIANKLATMDVNIRHLEAASTHNNRARINILAEVKSVSHLSKLISDIEDIKGVISARRVVKEIKEEEE